jgi:hypothetical protein
MRPDEMHDLEEMAALRDNASARITTALGLKFSVRFARGDSVITGEEGQRHEICDSGHGLSPIDRNLAVLLPRFRERRCWRG